MKLFLLLSVFYFSLATQAAFTSFAWEKNAAVYQAIQTHSFNQDLKNGTLSRKRFEYYQAQDALYLKEFAKALAILASKVEERETVLSLLEFAKNALQEGQLAQGEMNPSNLAYTSYLLATAALKTPAELASALLPCFWIYLELGKTFQPHIFPTHPYRKWIESYASPSYETSVNTMKRITDQLAEQASPLIHEKMLESFQTAFRWEWYFWEAAYTQEKWKPVLTLPGFSPDSKDSTDQMPF